MAPTMEKISAVTLRVVNMTESVRFYRDVLGMELLYGGEGTGFSSLCARDPQSAILNLEQHKPVTRCEIVTNVSQFRNASALVSWLGLCPENKISGGKVLHTKSRRVRSRFATGLRMVEPLHRAKDYLGEFFRRKSEARQTPSNHRHISQTRTNCLSLLSCIGAILHHLRLVELTKVLSRL